MEPTNRAEAPEQPQRGSQPQEQLPTERIAFEKQMNILAAYSAASDGGANPVSNEEVAKLISMNASTVSLANAFLVKMGFLNKVGRSFAPTKPVVEYANAVQWNQDNAAHHLRPIVENTWFWSTVKPRLSMGVTPEKDLIGALAQKAMVGPEYRPQLRMLLNYICASGLVFEESGNFTLNRNVTSISIAAETPKEVEETPAKEPVKQPAASAKPLKNLPHPLLDGLFETLPEADKPWPQAERQKWLDAAKHIFNLVYTDAGDNKE